MKRPKNGLKSFLYGCWILALLAFPLYAQQQPAGVVTGLQGQAQLTRSATPSPLRYKDGVIIRDVVDTREKSMARILFGGRSTVTVRELSRLEVREELLPTGARRDVYELNSGGILVNVARQLMRSGDEVIIRTPNAVAAVRGTTVFVQYNAAANQSTIVVLSGTALVQGQLLGPNGRATVSGTAVAFDTISQAEADQILNDSRIAGLPVHEDFQGQTDLAIQLTDTILILTGGPTDGPPDGTDPPETGVQGCLDCTTVSEAAAEIGGDSHGPPVFPLTPPGTLFIVNDSLTVPGNLFELPSGQNAEQPAPLLIATNAEIDIGGSGLLIGGSLIGPPSDPLFEIDPSTISTGDDLFHIGPTGNLSLSAPLLTDVGGTFVIGGDFLEIDGGLLDSTSPSALVQFNDTTVTITGDFFKVTSGNLTFDGHSLLNLSNGANFTAGGSILDLTNSDLDLGEHALIQVSNESTLETTAGPVAKITGGSLIADALVTTDGAANTFNLTGSVLDLTDATVTLRVIGEVLAEGDSDIVTFNLGANEPFIKMASSTFNLTGEGEHLVSFGTDEGEPVAQTGVALIATGTAENPSAITVAGPVLDLGGVHLTDTNPQIQLTHTTVTQSGSNGVIEVFGLPVTLAGPLLAATNSSISTERNMLLVDGSLTGLGTAPLIQNQIDPETVIAPITTNRSFIHILQGGDVSVAGGLFTDTGGTYDIDGSLLRVVDGASYTSTTEDPAIQMSGSSVTTGLSTIAAISLIAQLPPSVELAGPLLRAMNNTQITASDADPNGEGFVFLRDSATLTGPPAIDGDAPALIHFDTSSLMTTGPFLGARRSLNSESLTTLQLEGPLLVAANSQFITDSSFLSLSESARLTSLGSSALIQSNPSTFSAGINFLRLNDEAGAGVVNPGTPGPSSIELAGPFLRDIGSQFVIDNRFVLVGGASILTSTSSDPLIDLNGSTVTTGSDFLAVIDPDSQIILSGSLLKGGSTLNIGVNSAVSGDLVDINSGGQLVMNTADPVVELSGGTHTIGTADGSGDSTPNRIFRLQGVNTDVEIGLGTDQVIKGDGINPEPFDGAENPIGTLLKATGAAAIEVKAGPNDSLSAGVFPGNAIRLDTMLFEAALPIIQLIGTGNTEATATRLTTAGDSMDIFQSKVVSLGPVVDLDNGLIHVTNGAFITVRGGSIVDVTGDLLRLANGSKIEVINGPLIHVTGSSGTGSPSTLNVSGALVEFGGSGGNQIVVNNGLSVTGMRGGPANDLFPVNIGGETSSISVGTQPVINPALGNITVNGTGGQGTGALIQATSDGIVNIGGFSN